MRRDYEQGWGGSQGGWGLGWGWPQGGNGPLVGASIVAGQGGWNVNCGGGSGGNRVAIGLVRMSLKLLNLANLCSC